ncbi:cholinesterase 1-like [Stylophora pistillata]|nr:cholinesterase 1-like [Stylophora pistillata]
MALKIHAPRRMLFMVFLAMLFYADQAVDPGVVIKTKLGSLQGLTQVIPNAHGSATAIHKFLGIPYAAPPIDKLRFAPPQPHPGWKGVRQATQFRSICMQMIQHYNVSIRQAWEGFAEAEENISEDCLYLNIYTPQNASRFHQRYPVLAYIHGGGFFAGTPVRVVSPGEYLPTRGIILVSIQYRLGPFGFFTTGDSIAPGNYGMLDQVEALRWIQGNIEAFGGDPSKVTLLGESAGGASVNLHLLSTLSKGLFHRVISESGSDLSPFAFHAESDVTQSSMRLAKELGCIKNKNQMLACLRSKSAQDILKKAHKFLFYYPVVDKHFLEDSPINLRRAGKFQKVPTIAGFVSDEGSFLLDKSLSKYDKKIFRESIEAQIIVGLGPSQDHKPLIVDAVEFQYTHWPGQNNSSKIRQSIIDALTDYFVVAPTYASLLFQSQESHTWLYEFRHRSDHSLKEGWEGVAHGDITAYVFGVPLMNGSSPHPYTEVDRNISDFMVTVYTNFVKFGNTTPQPVHGIKWNNFLPNDQKYLRIEANCEMSKDFKPLKVAFWNDYLPLLSNSLKEKLSKCSGSDVNATRSHSCYLHKVSRWKLSLTLFWINISVLVSVNFF